MATPIRDFAATGAEERDILPRLALIWICDQWVFGEWVFGASGGFLFALDVDAGREVWRHSPGSKRGQISLRVDERQAVVMKAERALSDSGLETSVVIHHIESSGAKNPISACRGYDEFCARAPAPSDGDAFVGQVWLKYNLYDACKIKLYMI
jgi:hypothetical protein